MSTPYSNCLTMQEYFETVNVKKETLFRARSFRKKVSSELKEGEPDFTASAGWLDRCKNDTVSGNLKYVAKKFLQMLKSLKSLVRKVVKSFSR
ncbi:hypothetical protein J6590_093381 [Homalodisca vitripennis]|nr:hypothetical protein J6590_093381 [Homalodisca vitripennis]